ncbi:MFS transporter [Nocardia vermiculata]|uniref:Putative proline/betaine transporter n=1 Tax=Nocardia vermiculata TaxID=257274 RepID=A0A846XXD6_9NOCA|nr:MFS transporter [Nocardia vermiculata]NKY49748.1 MHS family MFS transporter [Nocardia vermiculata]
MSLTHQSSSKQRAKATFASWIGTTIEYYDFSCYGLAASLIFPKLFFSSNDPTLATVLSLATFAVGYIARPVGAIVFGHFGDRIGRKTALVFTLILMGASTFLIGLMPTYDQIGAAAPVILVLARLLQGFSVGGEYGGAVLMTVEHSGKKSGFFGSLVNTGATVGLILANLVFLVAFQLSDDTLYSWGWRIPFLLSAILVVVGLISRIALEETPEFEEAEHQGEVQQVPVVDVLRNHLGTVLLLAMGILAAGTAFTMTTVFSLSYGKDTLGLGKDTMLAVLLTSTVAILICLPLFGAIGDRFGIRRVFLGGAASMIVLPFCWFALMDTRQPGWMILGFAVIFMGYSANYAVVPSYFSQVFPPALRFTGMSVGITIGLIAGNAIAPSISSMILDATDSWLIIAIYMAGTGAISLLAGLVLRLPSSAAASTDEPDPTPAEAAVS